MTVLNPPQPFSAHAAVEGASPGLARRHVARFFRTHDLTTATDLPGFRHSHASVGGLSLNHLTYGTETVIGMPPLRDFYMLQWTLEGAATYRQEGLEQTVRAGGLFVVNPDRRTEKTWDASCTQLIVRLDRSLLDTAVAGWRAEETGRMPEADRTALEPVLFAPSPTVEEARTASLFAFLRALAGDARAGDVGWAHPRLAERAGAVLADLMLTALDHSAGGWLIHAGSARPQALSRAEEFIKVHAREPLRLDDIAEAAGVRPRTLHKAFQHHLGLTPIAYVRQVRLDLARRDLMEAARSGRTVTDVATDCGFDHLSKFAGSYKARYGESPSETVRRFRTG
ncbi:AraC-like DNA-binding protein [Amorphus suaedae]